MPPVTFGLGESRWFYGVGDVLDREVRRHVFLEDDAGFDEALRRRHSEVDVEKADRCLQDHLMILAQFLKIRRRR